MLIASNLICQWLFCPNTCTWFKSASSWAFFFLKNRSRTNGVKICVSFYCDVIMFMYTSATYAYIFSFLGSNLQTSYPKTAYIRKGWVARQLVKLIIFTGLMGFIVEQVCILFLISSSLINR